MEVLRGVGNALGLSSGVEQIADEPPRTVRLNDAHSGFASNYVSTTKYGLFLFLPVILVQQFTRPANFYFLVIGVLSIIPAVSPFPAGAGSAGTLGALFFVVSVSIVKEAFEDFRRYRSDCGLNSKRTQVLRGGVLREARWEEVQVGDIVRCDRGEFFPADLVLLTSSGPSGTCYIETANLDGETNLKVREALRATRECSTPAALAALSGAVECEGPNERLYTFSGKLALSAGEAAVGPENVLLRGCQLRNTEWVYGLAVYTGTDTKLMRNARERPVKGTNVERIMTRQIVAVFVILLALAAACAAGDALFAAREGARAWYLAWGGPSAASVLLRWLTFVVLYANIVPISLYVSLEMVKVLQCSFVDWDLAMYDEESDTPATARTSNLNEELGQVHYIFSDKTGTLTRNVMRLMRCSVGGVFYGGDEAAILQAAPGAEAGFEAGPLLEELRGGGAEAALVREFLTMLAVCHTVVPEGDPARPAGLVYQAASPDEEALVKGGRDLGFAFVARRPGEVDVREGGGTSTFAVLNVLEFDSTRKRMSAVVRGPDGALKLYTKGADTMIIPRLAPGQEALVEATREHLGRCAAVGLRTLCFARRALSEEEYADWAKVYDEASVAIAGRKEKVDAAAERLERGLELVGASAIEDRLQDGVPDALVSLAKAGIRLWVLTGDKQETAINIGFSCGLLQPEMQVLVMAGDALASREAALDALERHIADTRHHRADSFASDAWYLRTTRRVERLLRFAFARASQRGAAGPLLPREAARSDDPEAGAAREEELEGDEEEEDASRRSLPSPAGQAAPLALVIDGVVLAHMLRDETRARFMELGRKLRTCICCRVSPLQKAQVVLMVKEIEGRVTLAIGDGANDVPMIQSAHIGVGISGKEGMQAVLASDFAIAQFRFLKRLLLVHGRWSYKRVTKLILYCFYKNAVLSLSFLWFCLYCGSSGQTLYDAVLVTLYNTLFTAFPPIVMAVMDQDMPLEYAFEYPELYRPGQADTGFNLNVFWGWFTTAALHSLPIFFVPFLALRSATPDGTTVGMWTVGTVVFTCELLVVTLKLCLMVNAWTWTLAATVVASLAAYVAFLALLALPAAAPLAPELNGIAFKMAMMPQFWLALVATPLATLGLDYAWKYFRTNYLPSEKHKKAALAAKEARRRSALRGARGKLRAAAKLVMAHFTSPVQPTPVTSTLLQSSKLEGAGRLGVKQDTDAAPHSGYAFAAEPGQARLLGFK
eukprot:tig00000037_g10107.t1